ncbi:hypothetical protein [Kitasatospora sp. MBT63]|uniref:hypothetical protein n=1 Tax=Kitasatospora sp. MBT63 TaxID=1444768 RepID=UPI00053AD407|nr:hypothetical protein [Kitasatospora sp. MBT63]
MPVTHLVTGRPGSGKTLTIEQLIAAEKLASGPTIAVWGIEPTCPGRLAGLDRTVGADQAVQLLTEAAAVIAERLGRGREHEPTEAEPRIKVVIDGAEPILRDTEAAHLLKTLALTGRKAAVETVLAVTDTTLDSWPIGLRRQYRPGTVTELSPHPHTA